MVENGSSSAVSIGLWGVVSALVLWILSRMFELFQDSQNRRRVRLSVLRTLFAEVDYNTRDMEIFLARSPDIDKIRDKLLDPNFTPHITDARQTAIYHKNIAFLHYMQDDLVQDLVAFYGYLEKISSQVDGITKPSYKTISVAGQVNVIKGIYETCDECKQCGQRVLCGMMEAYPKLELKRNELRKIPNNNEQK